MSNIEKFDSDLTKFVNHIHNGGEIKSFLEDIYLITLYVAGLYYIDNIDEIFPLLKKGTILNFFREKNNKYDKSAILIKYNGKKIGYVPRRNNEILANLMDGGKAIYGLIEEIGVNSIYNDYETKFICFKVFLKE